MNNSWWLLLIIPGVSYWWDTLRAKEIARHAGLAICRRNEVQFLDDTVERKRLWLRRNEQGRLQLCRLYFFEFASDGAQRYQGRVTLLGHQVHEVEMDAYRLPDGPDRLH